MKKAIVTGATGLVGLAVSKHFASIGIDVLCLGRKQLEPDEISHIFGSKTKYLKLPMEEILLLEDRIKAIDWTPGDDCVFYHSAWGGHKKLTDGDFEKQFINVIHASNAVVAAKKLGCVKFINIGTIEETIAEQFLKDTDHPHPYRSTQPNYAIAKLASRDVCKMVSYLEKIDYVHTRLSVPLDPDLSRGGYISSVLKSISEGLPYEKPANKQLFDIIFLDDVANAYYLIGLKGRNKADYFIGTSMPRTLSRYFEQFEQLVNDNSVNDLDADKEENAGIFKTDELIEDTGFRLTAKFEDLIKHLR